MKSTTLTIEEHGKGSIDVVLIHGNSSSLRSFDRIINQELDDCRFVCLGLPGCADSKRSSQPAVDYTYSAIREAIAEVLVQSSNPMILFGQSLGGHLAIESIGSQQVKHLIISGSPPISSISDMSTAFLPFPEFSSFLEAEINKKSVTKLFDESIINQEVRPECESYFHSTDPQFRSVLRESLVQPGELLDEVEIIRNSSFPITVIQGKQDPFVNLQYIQTLDVPLEIVELDRCGHYPYLEKPKDTMGIIANIVHRMK